MSLLEKGNKLYSIFYRKCPHCHEGEFFKYKNPYNLKHLSATYENCTVCGRKLYIEPGFYYGALYVTYGLGVAHFVAIWVISEILNIQYEFWSFVAFISISLLLLTPFYHAISKIIWANMFMGYKGVERSELEIKEKEDYGI